MANDTWIIQVEQLREWYDALEKEPSVPGDGIDTVKEQISDILIELREKESTFFNTLTFEDIEIGETYLLRPSSSTKAYLHNKPVEIVDKKIKNVTGILKQNAGRYKAGARFTIPPSSLQKM